MLKRGGMEALKLTDECSLEHICVIRECQAISGELHRRTSRRSGPVRPSEESLTHGGYLFQQILSVFTWNRHE